MKNMKIRCANSAGFSLVELMAVVVILGILVRIVMASYQTLVAKSRFSKAKTEMEAIAKAGYLDYINNLVWDIAPTPWTQPASIMAGGDLKSWPNAPCPQWYYSWDNGTIFGINVVRVSLRRGDDTALWSYCVNTFGGGNCDAQDLYSLAPTTEISSVADPHLYCNE